MSSDGEPHSVLTWLFNQNDGLEKQVKDALDRYSANHPVGQWMRSNWGVGPVIAAGILSHIDITKAPTAGHLWSYAGFLTGLEHGAVEWRKGEKRPWNADLKKLLFLLGECFVKVSYKEDAFYAQIYKQRKELEKERNLRGDYAEQAKLILATKNWRSDTVSRAAYEKGQLPAAHIHARAKRYAVKMFLSHLHYVWYVIHYNRRPPNPYIIDHGGHAHLISPPNFDESNYIK